MRQEAAPTRAPGPGLVPPPQAQRPLPSLARGLSPPRRPPQHLPKRFTSPPRRQNPRDRPQQGALERARGGAQTLPLARSSEDGLGVRARARKASYFASFTEDGGL